ncbi:MAG: hypothetical protein H6964_14920 [Chromatiaceae bacterium]|nr:hypothetical protein [Gammaproteobacteria bacterium]MCP5448265.1 hypothetical protein [Chromatiaceae bacterium]MCB1861058.1 hypothetical protein [Gammaproteobacteria bacterium]MCB1871668.1 hypothetical protein [Gammaproteobacteria bacterium]MCB1879483.1 hypothetical protein [Gammaproteobacteria bacterium]
MKASISVAASGVATVSAVHNLEVEAVGRVNLPVPAGDTVAVDVQPGPVERLRLVFITADSYSDTLTYSVTGGPTDAVLDGPELFMGTGVIALLGATPNVFTFSNGGAEEVNVTVLVGRRITD